jgi:hypothetical protein
VKCPEITPLVPRFFDGELDGPLMRKIALHITRCADCERELRVLEKVQGLVIDHVAVATRGVDLDSVWSAVSARIDETPRSWRQRLESWWDDLEIWSPLTVWPAAAAAAAVFLAVNLWSASPGTPPSEVVRDDRVEITERIAQVRSDNLFLEAMNDIDNSAVFENIVGGVDTLMVEPKTQTAVIWIDDNGDFR